MTTSPNEDHPAYRKVGVVPPPVEEMKKLDLNSNPANNDRSKSRDIEVPLDPEIQAMLDK